MKIKLAWKEITHSRFTSRIGSNLSAEVRRSRMFTGWEFNVPGCVKTVGFRSAEDAMLSCEAEIEAFARRLLKKLGGE